MVKRQSQKYKPLQSICNGMCRLDQALKSVLQKQTSTIREQDLKKWAFKIMKTRSN